MLETTEQVHSDHEPSPDDSGTWRFRVWGIQRAWLVTGALVIGVWAVALLISIAAGASPGVG